MHLSLCYIFIMMATGASFGSPHGFQRFCHFWTICKPARMPDAVNGDRIHRVLRGECSCLLR